MSEVNRYKSRTVRVSSLEEHKVLAKITVKPYASLVTLLIVAIYLTIVSENKLFGIVIGLGCVCMILFVGDRTILEAADRYLIIFDPKNKEQCTVIYLSEIVSWEYVLNRKTEELNFVLDDGAYISCQLIMNRRLMRYLRDKMGAKEIKSGKQK
ncbi:MAG: hypothetical protein PUF50_05090 [Erysipelotrichaceae bacterium]|nr:hypothetical protein [Erysipelotrichaceae bacterium]